MKKILAVLLSSSIGILFLVSATSKLFPIEPFEYQLVDIGIANWETSPYLARFIIGIEFFLGVLLVLNIYLKRFTLYFAISLLLIFSIYLGYQLITYGNVGNCACFGELYIMTPLQGLLKNIVLLVCCMVCYLAAENDIWKDRKLKTAILFIFSASMCFAFLLYPVNPKFTSTLNKKQVNYKVPLDLMYADKQKQKPSENLLEGKHIIAFLSLSCKHCKIAAKKMAVIHKKNPSIPIYYVLNGEEEKVTSFLVETNSTNIPHHLFLGPQDWIKVAGLSLPNIMYIDNSIVRKKCSLPDISQRDMEHWLSK